MKSKHIQQVQKTSKEIDNFTSCYRECVLYAAQPDGDVKMEQILEWLIKNPHMSEIALKIKKIGGF